VFIFFILLSATLAVMALLVKMGVIKESVQRKITVWIFNFINYLFRGAINLAVRLRIITLFQGEKFYVRTIGYFFDNLLTNLVILGIILVMAIILTVTYLLQGELSMITSYDVLAIGVKLPIEYELSRWSDLLFLLLWLFVFFLTYKFLKQGCFIYSSQLKWKFFWRIIQDCWLAILIALGFVLGLAAVVIFGAAFYGLVTNILWLVALVVVRFIGWITIIFLSADEE